MSDLGTGQLLWVLYLQGSERFGEIEVIHAAIRAVAEEYPLRNEFMIPLNCPERFQVRCKKIN